MLKDELSRRLWWMWCHNIRELWSRDEQDWLKSQETNLSRHKSEKETNQKQDKPEKWCQAIIKLLESFKSIASGQGGQDKFNEKLKMSQKQM